ncbi:MAG: heliorhodopsin HeR [Dermatophilaceae bacterium]|nr:heliorhodopsin HeR [Intrasporangiaceae bacterium]
MSTLTDETRYTKLRRFNIIAAVVHAAQAVAVVLLANDFTLPMTATYMAGPPGTPPQDQVTIWNVPTALAIALFLALSSLFHIIVASPPFFDRYREGLKRSHNYFRWVEYSLSSSLMIVIIAQLVGISDMVALLALFWVNAAMILFGWLQEKYHQPGDGGWLPFLFGCVVGLIPWIGILLYVIAPGSTSGAEPPGFVYGIIVSLFLFFNSFALVQWLQYKQTGKFSDYLVGERTYIILSLVAKSLLAWQIFGGTLAG